MKLLCAAELQRQLGVSRNTVYKLLHRADLQTVRIGRRLLISDEELKRWLSEGGDPCLRD